MRKAKKSTKKKEVKAVNRKTNVKKNIISVQKKRGRKKIVTNLPSPSGLDIVHSLHINNDSIHGVVEKIVHPYVGRRVVVRTWGAGVHVGILKEFSYQHRIAFLSDDRRIYKWEGAFTLSEVSQEGISEKSKLSISLPELMVTQVEELIPLSKESIEVLEKIKPFDIKSYN